ncbi:deoxyribonuclease IV [Thermohalobacter berrensis]|uniref:Probable endonuclease 4 n=1 Tax=Thermohalobacter berrensis TaxID=99594 RepID=A0A419SV27_9FIRM|nr:deoxyribonuclease IV [Thermohalobacter berrensis]RKD29067.1 endonuclease IV [Thermohalobacter berrensis]
MYLGCHLSISKGYYKAAKTALDIGANTFQFFSRNPRGARAKKLDMDDVEKLGSFLKENNFGPIVAHAPYILNLASHKGKTWELAKRVIKEDMDRLEKIPCPYFVFHPGNHLGKGIEYGIERIAEGLNEIITGNENTMILLETMSGKGTEVGYKFEQIKGVIDKVKYSELLGVCLDTCHIYSAGYDIVNDLDNVLEEFDNIIGIDKLKAIHLNDSMKDFNSKKDRHEKIGEGTIGIEGIKNIIKHPQLKDVPFLLETPNDVDGYESEIKLLKELK